MIKNKRMKSKSKYICGDRTYSELVLETLDESISLYCQILKLIFRTVQMTLGAIAMIYLIVYELLPVASTVDRAKALLIIAVLTVGSFGIVGIIFCFKFYANQVLDWWDQIRGKQI